MGFISTLSRKADELLAGFMMRHVRPPRFDDRATLFGAMPIALQRLQEAYDEGTSATTDEGLCHEELWLHAVAERAAADAGVKYRGRSLNPRTDDGHLWRIALLFDVRATRIAILLPRKDRFGQSDRCAVAYVEQGSAATLSAHNKLTDALTRRVRGNPDHMI